jgi:hypothetical protein
MVLHRPFEPARITGHVGFSTDLADYRVSFWLAILGIWLLWAKSVERQFETRISLILGVIVLDGKGETISSSRG